MLVDAEAQRSIRHMDKVKLFLLIIAFHDFLI